MGIPRGKLGAVNTEKGEQVPGYWNTDGKYVATGGLWHSVLPGWKGPFCMVGPRHHSPATVRMRLDP